MKCYVRGVLLPFDESIFPLYLLLPLSLHPPSVCWGRSAVWDVQKDLIPSIWDFWGKISESIKWTTSQTQTFITEAKHVCRMNDDPITKKMLYGDAKYLVVDRRRVSMTHWKYRESLWNCPQINGNNWLVIVSKNRKENDKSSTACTTHPQYPCRQHHLHIISNHANITLGQSRLTW